MVEFGAAHLLVQVLPADFDGSDEDGVNVVLLGGAFLCVTLLLSLAYWVFRTVRRRRKARARLTGR